MVVVELGLYYAVVLAIDYYFFDGTRFRDAALHPFWLAVLLPSIQYGMPGGLAGAVTSSLVLLVGNLPPQPITQDLYQYVLGVLRLPLMWLVAAVILGELRSRQIRERDELAEGLILADKRNLKITESYLKLREAQRRLEGRVAGQMKTVVATYKAARAVESLNEAEVIQGSCELIKGITGAKKFSIFLTEGDALKLSVQEGWEPEDRFDREIRANSPLFAEVLGKRGIPSVAKRHETDILAGQGLIAGPLIDSEDDKVLGMLKIEDLAFIDFNVTTVESFRILCEWSGTAIGNARRFTSAGATSYMNTSGTFYSSGFFAQQVRFVQALKRRNPFDVSVMFIRPAQLAALDEASRAAFSVAVHKGLGETLRGTDMGFDCSQMGLEFRIILPFAPPGNGPAVVSKLEPKLRAHLPPSHKDMAVDFAFKSIDDVDVGN